MIILSLGSNLTSSYGDRFKNLEYAVNLLEKNGIIVEKKSSFYETFSYPDKNNPKFINMVILVKTNLTLVQLMNLLLTIEKKLGRTRNKKNEPRTCDIDIIDYNNEVKSYNYNNLDLTVPHKNLSSRNFVLFPLKEILPNWKHPKTNENVTSLIQKLPEDDTNSILKIKKN